MTEVDLSQLELRVRLQLGPTSNGRVLEAAGALVDLAELVDAMLRPGTRDAKLWRRSLLSSLQDVPDWFYQGLIDQSEKDRSLAEHQLAVMALVEKLALDTGVSSAHVSRVVARAYTNAATVSERQPFIRMRQMRYENPLDVWFDALGIVGGGKAEIGAAATAAYLLFAAVLKTIRRWQLDGATVRKIDAEAQKISAEAASVRDQIRRNKPVADVHVTAVQLAELVEQAARNAVTAPEVTDAEASGLSVQVLLEGIQSAPASALSRASSDQIERARRAIERLPDVLEVSDN